MKKLILASGSPRRKQILEENGFKFEVMPADIDESIWANESPVDYVKRLCFEKAAAIAHKVQGDLVILAADTIVCFKGLILGKPRDEKDAYQMLKKLSGQMHSVLTGFVVYKVQHPKESICDFDETRVTFRLLSDTEITAYIATKEPFDKAGAYAIQGSAKEFVDFIEGSYMNVVGLPIEKISEILKSHLTMS